MKHPEILWKPGREQLENSLISSFIKAASERHQLSLPDFQALYRWSIGEKEAFWSLLWDFCGVVGRKGERVLENGTDMERARWFPDATLNYAENLLAGCRAETAILATLEDLKIRSLSPAELRCQVGAVAAWLRNRGVVKGDRVAGLLPNIAETMVAMLATTSIGAIWTSTSPDFGVESVLERFGQTRPKVLFGVDGYRYNGKEIVIVDKLGALAEKLDSLEASVLIRLLDSSSATPRATVEWEEVLDQHAAEEPVFTPCSFSDPVYILYSSGTTGQPKCITHRIGGTLLQHLKEHRLHCDIRPGDRFFYFTTCGWMMWNWLASVLASGAAPVLYDGSPFAPDHGVLWRYAEQAGVTLFGTSAKYLDGLRKNDCKPKEIANLEALRTICSTGSVLSPESYDYVYQAIKPEVCLSSISGGTDIVSCFALGCPILPVYRGELQCRGLGMAVEVFDREGNSIVGGKGELVCTAPFPCQPAFFWGDDSGTAYHRAYFGVTPNVWHHGDYVELTERGTMIFFGRSDATLNPGGVRIGTAEIYRYVEQLDEVVEAVAIGQDWDRDTRLVLFVALRPGCLLDEALSRKIREVLRSNCTPRHVPGKILQVETIPRTKSGKIVELAVREVVHGRPVENLSSLANPEALEQFRNRPELKT